MLDGWVKGGGRGALMLRIPCTRRIVDQASNMRGGGFIPSGVIANRRSLHFLCQMPFKQLLPL